VSNRCSEVNDEASKKYKFGGISRTEFVKDLIHEKKGSVAEKLMDIVKLDIE
jgi:hypothetical protein